MIPRFTPALLVGFVLAPTLHAQPPANARTDSLGDPLPKGAIARLGTLRLKHDPGPWGTSQPVFSPNGKLVASDGQTDDSKFTFRSVRLWDTTTGKEFPGPWKSVDRLRTTSLAFSPDSSILADAHCILLAEGKRTFLGYTIVLWDVANARPLRTILIDRGTEPAIAFGDGGKTIVCADGISVRWFDVTTGKELRSWTPVIDKALPAGNFNPEWYWHLAPDGKHLLAQLTWRRKDGTSLRSSEVVVLDLATRKEVWRAKFGESFNRSQFAFSADGKKVALQLDELWVELRDSATGKVLGVPPVDVQAMPMFALDAAPSLALSHNGNVVAMGRDSFVLLWNLNAPAEFQTIKTRLIQYPLGFRLAFSPDGKSLAIWGDDDLALYDVATLQQRLPAEGHRSAIEHLRYSWDGKQLFSISTPANQFPHSLRYLPEIIDWDTATWKQRKITSTHMSARPNIGRASPAGNVYLGNGADDHFKLHDLTTGDVKGRLSGSFDKVVSWFGVFSPDGNHYLFAGDDKSGKPIQRLYAIPSGKFLCDVPQTWRDYSSRQFGAISSDGLLMAVFGSWDHQLRVFETSTGKLLHRFGDESRNIPSHGSYARVAFSWDGKRLAYYHPADELARHLCIWDLATGKQSKKLPVTGSFFEGLVLAWSADDRMLAVAQHDKISLWETLTGKLRHTFTHHQGGINALAFSPNGRYLASGSANTTVLIWDLWDR